MSKRKRKKRKRGKKDDKLKNKSSKKEKKGRDKIEFELDKEDISPKKVIDDIIDGLKSARSRIKTPKLLSGELIFARDILFVIDEVVTKYDDALSSGKFSTSPVAQYLYSALNNMLAAYQNIERMLIEKPFDFLDDYYGGKRFAQKGKGPDSVELKHGRKGKHHIPMIDKERRKRRGGKNK